MGLLSTIGAASGRAFGLTRVAGAIRDAYFNLTTLLLPGNGTNGAQNNTFLDSSSNNFTITRNGNTTQGTFSPFSQTGWSAFCAGSGYNPIFVDAGSACAFGTGDFTIELFFYGVGSTGADQVIYDQRPNATNGLYPTIYLNNSTTKLVYYVNSADRITADTTLTYNTWTHIVVSRVSSVTRMFINGVQQSSTYADTSNYLNGSSRPILGHGFANNSAYPNGYYSNVRVLKGTGVTFVTVPNAPLTNITNTSLLICQSNRFVDNSTNNFTISTSGTPSVQAFSPFAPTAAYSAATVGGSGYFDGSGDFLSIAANAAFNFGAPSGNTNDFTIEMWVYPTRSAFVDFELLYGTGGSGGQDQLNLYANGTAQYYDGTNNVTSPALVLNQWNHVAVVRNGASSNNLRVYANGVSGTAVTSTNSLGSSVTSPRIGLRTDGVNPYQGYISSVRVVKGTAVYTGSTFTVPSAPLTAITNTSALLNFTNAGITDATAKNVLETVGNAQISTTQSKFGGSSMYFDGVGDNLTIPSSPLRALGTSDFTIEFWFNASSIPTFAAILDMRNPNTDNIGFDIMFYFNKISFGTATSVYIAGVSTLSTGTWYHYALTRSGNTFKQFLNGTQEGTTYTGSSTQNFTNTLLKIADGSNGPYTGYLDDIRITRGYARYTSNFTPPTAAYPTQ